MRRVLVIAALLLITACQSTPSPTPRPIVLPYTPTPAITIVTLPPRTEIPTWTAVASLTNAPTATRLPSNTPRPTSRPRPTRTPIGGEIGVVNGEGLLTIRLRASDIADALNEQRKSFYFTGEINSVPIRVTLEDGRMIVQLSFNDMTTRGVLADVTLGVRVLNNGLLVDLFGHQTVTGHSLSGRQLEFARQLLRLGLTENAIPAAIRRYEPALAKFDVLDTSLGADGLLLTVKIETAPAE